MEYRCLGSSGLLVSPVCLGTMTFGTPVGEADAVRLVHAAIDMGINFIDTANAYEGYARVLGSAGGVGEEITGAALKGKREDVVLATKVGSPLGPGQQDRGLTASHILREVDRSLQRLATEYIDLYIVHWPDKCTSLEITLSAIEQAQRQGKIRNFGMSNHPAALLCEALWIADKRNWPRVVSSQIPVSLLQRNYQNDLAFCERHQIAVTPYQSLQGGLLTGKYSRDKLPPKDSRAAEKPGWVGDVDETTYDKLEALEQVAQESDLTLTQLAVSWTLAQPAITSLVVGAKRVEQVEQIVAACDAKIPREHYARIDEICPPPWKPSDPLRGSQ